jgi:hypothetical protein
MIETIIERGPYAPEVEHQSHGAYILCKKGGRSENVDAASRKQEALSW